MVSTNNKGHPNLTPQRSLEYPQVSDTANIANSRYPTKSKVGPDDRTLKENRPQWQLFLISLNPSNNRLSLLI